MAQFTSAIMAPATAAFLLSFLAPSVYATPIHADPRIVNKAVECLGGDVTDCIPKGYGTQQGSPNTPNVKMARSSTDVEAFSKILADERDPEYTECMKKAYPTYPDVDFIDPQVAKDCHGATHTRGQSTGDLVRRGKSFDLKSSCVSYNPKKAPNVFQEAAPFRAKTDGFCDKMRDAVIDKGEGENREVLNDTTFKYGSASKPTLRRDNPNVLALKTTFTLTDHGKELIKKAEDPKAAYNELCRPAFEQFGTKGPGCTEELKYLKPLRIGGGGSTTTLVKSGDMKVFDGKEEIGTLIVDLEVINDWPGVSPEEEDELDGVLDRKDYGKAH